ncbi:MAG: sigma-70 family RNA polymerase sigma factor [Bacteroidales bacterium]|nr:sigma-70 family RNA polymerase sigma factor [Bacteroidales bacterium]
MDYTAQQFEKIFKESYPMMYRVAYSLVEDEEDAKDAVNQVFTEVWHKKPKISEGAEIGYLLTATKNQCLHTLQKIKHRNELRRGLTINEDKPEDAEHQELMQELHRAIEKSLTEQDWRVLSLHYYDDLTYEETAEVLGISSSAVNKHITHSLSKLRAILNPSK